jgi:hypothetical protein
MGILDINAYFMKWDHRVPINLAFYSLLYSWFNMQIIDFAVCLRLALILKKLAPKCALFEGGKKH